MALSSPSYFEPSYFDPMLYLSHDGTDTITNPIMDASTNATNGVMLYTWRCPRCTHLNQVRECDVVRCHNCEGTSKFLDVVTLSVDTGQSYDRQEAVRVSKQAEEFISLAERFGIG